MQVAFLKVKLYAAMYFNFVGVQACFLMNAIIVIATLTVLMCAILIQKHDSFKVKCYHLKKKKDKKKRQV